MSILTKTDLENLLQEKNLGNTFFSDTYDKDPFDVSLASTEIARLDTELGGGLPRGHLSEIVGAHSTGRMSVMHAVFAAATNVVSLLHLLTRSTLLIRNPVRRLASTFHAFSGFEGVQIAMNQCRTS